MKNKKFFAVTTLYAAITAVVFSYFFFYVIGDIDVYAKDTSVTLFDTLFGAQMVASVLIALGLLIVSIKKGKKYLIFSAVILLSVAVLVLPASIIQNTRYYHKASDGGPAGAQFDCSVWSNPYKYSSTEFEASCITMHTPALNTALLNTRESYYLEFGPAYLFTFVISEIILLGAPYLAFRRLSNRG